MGRPPGSCSTHPVFPSGVPKETASKARLVAGRFTFIALLKSIRWADALTGPSAALAGAVAAVFAFWRESGVSRTAAPRSKLMLVHSDNIQAVGEDMGTSKAQTRLSSPVALGGRTPRVVILAATSRIFHCQWPARPPMGSCF